MKRLGTDSQTVRQTKGLLVCFADLHDSTACNAVKRKDENTLEERDETLDGLKQLGLMLL